MQSGFSGLGRGSRPAAPQRLIGSNLIERLLQVRPKVIWVLDPNRKTHKIIADAATVFRLWAVIRMSGARRVGREAFGAAKTHSELEYP